jgi:hypothetical protein
MPRGEWIVDAHRKAESDKMRSRTRCVPIPLSKNSARKSSREVASWLIHIEELLIYMDSLRG